MNSYFCPHCGYIYNPETGDPESGVSIGTSFKDISEEWVCPVCGVNKDMFKEKK